MAVFAFLAIFAFVTVVVLMAAETISWQFLFRLLVLFYKLGCVATGAWGFLVLAE